MAIQGVQVIYRLRTTIRLFVDYRTGVDFFNLYYSNVEAGPYSSLGSVKNVPSESPATRGKIVFEFHTDSLVGWDDDSRNYIKLAPVVGGVESGLEGPLMIPTRTENIVPKEYSVMYGLNKDSQKFIPISVDSSGKVITTI
jgi:hypothetical protein